MHWFVICSDAVESTCLECPNLSRCEQRGHHFIRSSLGIYASYSVRTRAERGQLSGAQDGCVQVAYHGDSFGTHPRVVDGYPNVIRYDGLGPTRSRR